MKSQTPEGNLADYDEKPKNFLPLHQNSSSQQQQPQQGQKQDNINSQKVAISSIICRPSDALSQIKYLSVASGILALFAIYLSVGTFERASYLQADYTRGYLQNEQGTYQSWYLLATGLSCAFFQSLNLIILMVSYLVMTNTGCSQDIGYFQKWYNTFKWILLVNYCLFAAGILLIFGTVIAAIQINYPFYCDFDVPGRIQIDQSSIREDVYPCDLSTYSGVGVFKRVGTQFAIAVYAAIPFFCLVIVGLQIWFHYKWQKQTLHAFKVPSKGLTMWLDSLHLERDYKQIFADHQVTLRWLKKLAHREMVIYEALKDLGVTQVGDMLKIIASIKSIKNNNDLDSDEGVDLSGQDRALAYQNKKFRERQAKMVSEKDKKKQKSDQSKYQENIHPSDIQQLPMKISSHDDEEQIQEYQDPQVQLKPQKNERLAKLQQLVSRQESNYNSKNGM